MSWLTDLLSGGEEVDDARALADSLVSRLQRSCRSTRVREGTSWCDPGGQDDESFGAWYRDTVYSLIAEEVPVLNWVVGALTALVEWFIGAGEEADATRWLDAWCAAVGAAQVELATRLATEWGGADLAHGLARSLVDPGQPGALGAQAVNEVRHSATWRRWERGFDAQHAGLEQARAGGRISDDRAAARCGALGCCPPRLATYNVEVYANEVLLRAIPATRSVLGPSLPALVPEQVMEACEASNGAGACGGQQWENFLYFGCPLAISASQMHNPAAVSAGDLLMGRARGGLGCADAAAKAVGNLLQLALVAAGPEAVRQEVGRSWWRLLERDGLIPRRSGCVGAWCVDPPPRRRWDPTSMGGMIRAVTPAGRSELLAGGARKEAARKAASSTGGGGGGIVLLAAAAAAMMMRRK